MPLSSSSGQLSRHAGRLARDLDALGERLRQSAAEAVGRAVGDAVGDAVHAALGGTGRPGGFAPAPSFRPSSRPSAVWGGHDDSPWDRDPYDPQRRDPLDDYDEYDPYRLDPDDDEHYGGEPAPAPEASSTGRWSAAVVAGLQASAWWLRRHPGRLPLLTALGVGLAAGLAGLTAATLAGSAVGLLALFDLLFAGSALLNAN